MPCPWILPTTTPDRTTSSSSVRQRDWEPEPEREAQSVFRDALPDLRLPLEWQYLKARLHCERLAIPIRRITEGAEQHTLAAIDGLDGLARSSQLEDRAHVYHIVLARSSLELRRLLRTFTGDLSDDPYDHYDPVEDEGNRIGAVELIGWRLAHGC